VFNQQYCVITTMGASKSKGEVTLDNAEDVSVSNGVQRRRSITSLNDLETNTKETAATADNGMRRARSSLSIPRRFSYSTKRSLSSQKRAQTMPKDFDDLVKVRKRIAREAKSLKAWVDNRTCKCHEVPNLSELASMAVANRLKDAQDVSKLPIFQELKYAVEFRFCPSFDDCEVPDKVQFSNHNRSIVYTGRGYSTTCMKTPFGKGLRNGRHAWLLHVDSSRVVGWMHIGIVNEERKELGCQTVWDGNPHPFRQGEMSRSSNGNFNSGEIENRVQSMQFAGGYTTGDTVGIKLDLDMGTVQWLRNGEDFGEPAQIQDGVYFPSVSLDSPGEGVTLAFYAGSPGI